MKNKSFRNLLHAIGLSILSFAYAQPTFGQNPHTDSGNSGNWVLRSDMSDEFNGNSLNESKWQISGKNGVYWNTKPGNPGFTGRGYAANSYDTGWEFSPNNVSVKNGKLLIQTKYEPNYAWSNNPNNYNFEYTTGGIWSKETIKYGYMEIRCKLDPNAATTSAFWTTGSAEIDVFEAIGKHNTRSNKMWSSLHDWSIPLPNVPWTETSTLPFHFGDGFHTYSAEWTDEYLNIYADGQLIHGTTKAWAIENGIDVKSWPIGGDLHVWADSEVFPWWGIPNPNDLPGTYEVEYIRVWEKGEPTTDTNLIKNSGFETGDLSNWNLSSGKALVVSTQKTSGNYGVRINSTGGIVGQEVTVSPNTTYTLKAKLKVGSNDKAFFGVKNYGGTTKRRTITNTIWAESSFSFTTGASATKATIYLENNNTGQLAFMDEVSLIQAGVSSTLKMATLDSELQEASDTPELIRVFPNPYSGDNLTIEMSSETDVTIFITDINGNFIFNKSYNGLSTIKIDASELKLNSGMYILKATFDGKSSFQKVLVR